MAIFATQCAMGSPSSSPAPLPGSKTYGTTVASGYVQLHQGDKYITNITNINNAPPSKGSFLGSHYR